MTIEEVLSLVSILESNYPSIYGKRDEEKAALQTQTWMIAFSDYDFVLVHKALTAAMLKKPDFPPGLHEVMDELRKITRPESDLPSAEMAWECIMQCCQSYPVGSPWGQWNDYVKDEFDTLTKTDKILSSPQTKQALRSVGGWMVVGATKFDELPILRAQFVKAYDGLADEAKDNALIPPALLVELAEIKERHTVLPDKQADKITYFPAQKNNRLGTVESQMPASAGLMHIDGILKQMGMRV